MHKRIVASLLAASILLEVNAKEISSEKLQLVAKNISTKDNIITITGDAVAYSPLYYLSADKMVYDKDKEILELFDNVLIIKENRIQTQSNYAYVDLKEDIINQDPVFLLDSPTSIWTNARESFKEKENIKLHSTIISSCDCVDPFWSIRTSSTDYDTDAMWVNTYNSRLYIKDVPVFYLPYFGFPTDTTRRTGLLLPTIGFSSGEGLYYSQPIFIAPADNYDIEVIPQIRTTRGYGGYVYYRYADSPDSILFLKTGYFKESSNYMNKEKLEHSDHYGFDVNYKRKNIFAQRKNHNDGMFASIKYLNDVEYVTLEEDEDDLSTDKRIESKFNYYYDTPNYYAGAYARYYIDASVKSNERKDTLQEIPSIQLHSYNKELFLENLIYSIDFHGKNHTRREGLEARVYDISVPISYSRNILDDYLYVGIENKTTLTHYDYYGNSLYKNMHYDDGTLIQNRTSFILGSDLIKPYQDYLHTISLSASYDIPENWEEDGDLHNITVGKSDTLKYNELSIFPTVQDQKIIKLSLNQSLYDKEDLKQFINHKMTQSILYDSMDDPKLQDLDNYIKINHKYGSISGRIIYNVDDEKIVEGSFDSSFKYENFTLNAGYYYSKKTDNEFNARDDSESYRVTTSYKVAKDYSLSYYENYDLHEKIRNRQGVGLNIDDNCWNLDLRVEKEITPRSRYREGRNSYDSHKQTIVYAILMLKPIGGIRQKYKVEDNATR